MDIINQLESLDLTKEQWLELGKEKEKTLSPEILIELGFELVEEKPFENIDMFYYGKNGIFLFFNDQTSTWGTNSFLLGAGEMRAGKYYVVTFRWIQNIQDLFYFYEAVTGKSIK